ncbi:MAG: hypothetical protein IT371_27440 [Deltaproteobacteria bacterium]|nr:hypothetical protein [Deltaproteobacteria bacterium]
MKMVAYSYCVVLGAALGACGGGGETTPQVARVELRETGALLTAQGATRQLHAVAYGADGREVAATLTWKSSRPNEIEVDGSGLARAVVENGAAQLTAEVGEARSASLLVVATRLPPGTVELTDEQLVGEPAPTDPAAAPAFENTVRVELTGVPAPAVGALLIGTGSKVVAGRVRSVDTTAGRIVVTLGLVSLREAFPNLKLNETLDLTRAPMTIEPSVAAAYDVVREGNRWSFTPKKGSGSADEPSRQTMAAGSGSAPPFIACKFDYTGNGTTLPITLSSPPTFSVTQTFGLDLVYTAANGLERFVLRGAITPAIQAGVTLTAAIEGKVTCEQEIFTLRIPVGGALAVFISGLIPLKVGIELAGKLTLATAGVGVKAEATVEAQLGVACPAGGSCGVVNTLTGTGKAEPKLDLPGLGDLRFEASIMGFGKAELAIGNPFLRALRFSALEAMLGPKMQGNFALQTSQILDASYKSDYKATFEASVGLAMDFARVLRLLGIPPNVSAPLFSLSVDLGRSPAGTVTADRSSFAAGDTVNVAVRLDPATVNFYPVIGPYNVKRILLSRLKPGDTLATEVGSAAAASGQTEFAIAYRPNDSGSASELTAFVVTTLLPFDVFALELGPANGSPGGYRVTAPTPPTLTEDQAAAGLVIPITVERPNGSGGFEPVRGVRVELTASCGTITPASATTDISGQVQARLIAPASCGSVRITIVVRDRATGNVLAQETRTVTITPNPLPDLTGNYRVDGHELSLQRCGQWLQVAGHATVTQQDDRVSATWTVDTQVSPDNDQCKHSTFYATMFPATHSFTGRLVKTAAGGYEIVDIPKRCGGSGTTKTSVGLSPWKSFMIPEAACGGGMFVQAHIILTP